MQTPIDNIRLRELRSLQWYEPKQVLINLRYVETHLLTENMDERVRRLRTNELKELREDREAAIFAYGLETEVIKNRVLVANTERSDYDFVMRWIKDENEYFCPVQLKELPPDDLNAQVSLEEIYNKLEKYSGTDDRAVAIHVNRRMRLKWGPWERQEKPRIRELWLFGTNSPDPSRWFICGDIRASTNLDTRKANQRCLTLHCSRPEIPAAEFNRYIPGEKCMTEQQSKLGFIGITVGAAALMLVLVHFWAGPFSPQASLETVVAEKAVAIRDATVAALKGEDVRKSVPSSEMNLDKALDISASVLGGVAVILGVLGFAKKESIRVAGGAAVLGAGAIAFQFAALAVGAIVVAILIAAVLSQLSFS